MKSLIAKIAAAILIAATLAGCGTIVQESATDWMERQSQSIGD